MGCKSYYLSDLHETPIRFSEGDNDLGCLCTFPHNDMGQLSADRVRSLAYLGAAVVMLKRGDIDDGYLPGCLPEWIREEIDRLTIGSNAAPLPKEETKKQKRK